MGTFLRTSSLLLFILVLTQNSYSSTRSCIPLFSKQTVHAYITKHNENNPFLYFLKEVERIEATMPQDFHFLAPKTAEHRYDKVVYQLVEIRRTQHQQLLNLHNKFKKAYPNHPLNQAFKSTLKQIEIFEYDIAKYLVTQKGRKAARKYEYSQKQKNTYGHSEYLFRPHLERKLAHLTRSTRGFITELVTSLHLPNVISQGIHVNKLLSKHMIQILVENGVTEKELEKFKSFEIDVVFNQGHSWGEVKNFAYTLDAHFQPKNSSYKQTPISERLLFRAELIAKMLKILNKNNYNINMHYYFYNSGVSRSLQSQLRDLDIIVEN